MIFSIFFVKTTKFCKKKYLIKKRSGIPTAGDGLFAKIDIPPSTFIGVYSGSFDIDDNEEGDIPGRLEKLTKKKSQPSFAKAINGELTLAVDAAKGGCLLRYANSLKEAQPPAKRIKAENAECYPKDFNIKPYPVIVNGVPLMLYITGDQCVKKGDELFIDYGPEYWINKGSLSVKRLCIDLRFIDEPIEDQSDKLNSLLNQYDVLKEKFQLSSDLASFTLEEKEAWDLCKALMSEPKIVTDSVESGGAVLSESDNSLFNDCYLKVKGLINEIQSLSKGVYDSNLEILRNSIAKLETDSGKHQENIDRIKDLILLLRDKPDNSNSAVMETKTLENQLDNLTSQLNLLQGLCDMKVPKKNASKRRKVNGDFEELFELWESLMGLFLI